jgi:hypothetical protein
VIVKLSPSALKNGHWYEYLVRFILGGVVTAFTGLIGSRFGTSVGGLFLALPAIFCASATLIARHEERRKHEAGLRGQRRGQQAAALDAAGAALGSVGMFGFALTFSLLVERAAPMGFAAALAAWAAISVTAWWVWRRRRVTQSMIRKVCSDFPKGSRSNKEPERDDDST